MEVTVDTRKTGLGRVGRSTDRGPSTDSRPSKSRGKV